MTKLVKSNEFKVTVVDKVTKVKLKEFIKWTSSRHNQYKKSYIVNFLYENIKKKTMKEVFSCGVYSERSKCSGVDYLLLNQSVYKGQYRENSDEFIASEELRLRSSQTLSQALDTILNIKWTK
jgi:hypothetical protein